MKSDTYWERARHDLASDPASSPFAHGHGEIDKVEGVRTIMGLDFGQRVGRWSGPNVTHPTYPNADLGNADDAFVGDVWNTESVTLAAFRDYDGPVLTVDLLGVDEMQFHEECQFLADAYFEDARDPEAEEQCPSCAFAWYDKATGTSTWSNTGVTTSNIFYTLVDVGGADLKVEVSYGGDTVIKTTSVNEIQGEGCGDPPMGAKAYAETDKTGDRVKIIDFHPNPFNPSTTFSVDLSAATQVVVQIYDIQGRHVETIGNGFFGEGKHRFMWDAGTRPSGVYFVRIQTGDQLFTRKITLLK